MMKMNFQGWDQCLDSVEGMTGRETCATYPTGFVLERVEEED